MSRAAYPALRGPSLAAALGLAAFAAVSPIAAQPNGRGNDVRVIYITVPQFVAHADSFRAVDESGWTDVGSDEVRAVFADFNPINERVTKEYDNVDSGETIAFIAEDRCITPLPDCSGGRETVSFMVSLWEMDADIGFTGIFGLEEPNRIGAHDVYEDGPGSGSDLLGRASVGWSRLQLLGTLPNVGDTVERQVDLNGGDGDYRFTYRITRLPNVRKRVVIPVPTREP